jgi:Protein of unknown function (DUF2849)
MRPADGSHLGCRPCDEVFAMTSPLEQKIKITGPVVVTANRVGDGAVVYRRADGGWTTDLDDAAIATTVAVARQLIDAAAADDLRAVGPYVAPVKLGEGGRVRPGNLRELIRLAGPTIDLPITFGI